MTIGILIDITGIQKYIFSTNELRLNIGASQNIEHFIFGSYLKTILKEFFHFKEDDDITYWKDSQELLYFQKGYPMDIGYIGGGNAFLFAKDNNIAKEFCQVFTKYMLLYFPGLSVSIATEKFEDVYNKELFIRDSKKNYLKLEQNKTKFISQNEIPAHGITDFCRISGQSATTENSEKFIKQNYISANIESKRNYKKQFNLNIGDLKIPSRLEDLGQIKGEENYIAIVHIDGNGIGKLFENKSFTERRTFSKNLSNLFNKAFENLIFHITQDIWQRIKEELNIENKQDKDIYLPIRPIIFGGDDITFVSNGKLGIYLAKYYMEQIEKLCQKIIGENITTCGGVAIIKTKFPFFQAYKLAEQACNNAKTMRKKNLENFDIDESWLDYHINYFGFSGTLDDIRDYHFKMDKISLLKRPYRLGEEEDGEFSLFDTLLENINILSDDEKWPNSKIHELRKALYFSIEEQRLFIQKMQAEGRDFHKFKVRNNFKKELIWSDYTPYYDMIELKDFYPDFALKRLAKKDEVKN